MHPVILKLGPITLYSFGLMLTLAFLTANYFFVSELRRRKMDERHATQITMICLIGGVAGSKLFSILESFSDFLRNPLNEIFSPAGLTFYGGFIVAIVWLYYYFKKKRLSFLPFADMISPTVLLAYGVGRIGCQLAGDGDYGIPSKLPWAMAYPQGTAKPSATLGAFFDRNPVAESTWHFDSLSKIFVGHDALGQSITRFDQLTTVHPAPVYETIACFFIFYFLWKNRTSIFKVPGRMFAIVLVAMGLERLLVEFIRLNPLYLGLSMAQWISIAMIIVGGVWLNKLRRNSAEALQIHTA